MEIIRIDSDQLNIGKVGKAGEHNDTTLIFTIPEELLGYKIYDLEFEMASGRKIAIHDVNSENNELSVSLIDYILEYGSLYVEIVGYKFNPDIITKSKTYVGFVERGINAAVEEICKKASLVAQLYKEIEELRQSIENGGTGGSGGGDCGLPVAYINDNGELIFELAGDVVGAEINASGELELAVETEDGDKILNLGKVKGRTPYFQLNNKVLEIKYDDESSWAALVDFSTIASSFDLRLNQETYWLEAQREVDGEWEQMVDLSALKLAHEHTNKAVLDKFTENIFKQAEDAILKKHEHSNLNILEGITEYDVENIADIPVIEEEVSALVEDVDALTEDISALTEDVNELARNQGRYNEIDTEGKYAHIIGNGTDENNRSNAHTLDWEGNAWYAGKVTADCVETESIEAENANIATLEADTLKSASIDTTTISAKSMNIEVIDENSLICIVSVTTEESRGKTDLLINNNGPLSEQDYYVVYDGTAYKLRCTKGKNDYHIGDKSEYGFEIYQNPDGIVAVYFADNIGHDLSLYAVEPYMTDLFFYIDGLKEEIKSLPDNISIPTKTSELINDSEFITIDDIPESTNLSAMVNGETLVLSSSLGQEIEEAIDEIEAMIDESGVLNE